MSQYINEYRKLARVGIIPNQNLFSFSSDKDRRTDCRIRRKYTAQPRRESNPRALRIPVERVTGIRKTMRSIPGVAALCIFV